MLQFWKKNGHKDKNHYSSNATLGPSSNCSSFESNSLPINAESATTNDESEPPRLPRTLDEVLTRRNALNYFVQFMESRNAACYILCWLDIESFKQDANSVHSGSSNVLNEQNQTETTETATMTQQLIDEALAIFKKYIAQEAPMNIKCSDEIRNEIIQEICANRVCFDAIQNFLWDTMSNDYLAAFLTSDYYCKHQIDILTSGNVALEDILHNETALFYLMEYLELENAHILLEFWIAATNFQQQLETQEQFYDPAEAQNDAVVLYDKYFSLQALCPLGLGDRVRFEMEQNICGENGLVKNAFDAPLRMVESILKRNHLKPFLSSQLFYKYLSELINTVQSNGYGLPYERSPSDCSSEKSYSTNSTFLALEINHNASHKKNKEKTDMTIDTRLLNDPDSLWKRRRTHSSLSCGRVTALGKFETDLEPEPDKKGFKLKDMMKKFVSLDEEEKKKEEMAWQVAEMIVNDITSITLNKGNVGNL